MQPARRDPPHAGTKVSRVPADALHRGASAVLIGDALDLDTVGRNAGTIGYETNGQRTPPTSASPRFEAARGKPSA
jgi:hypothetical protein